MTTLTHQLSAADFVVISTAYQSCPWPREGTADYDTATY